MARIKVGDRIRVNFYFDSQVLEALRKIADLKNTTYSELLRIACREYVIREGSRAIEARQIMKDIK